MANGKKPAVPVCVNLGYYPRDSSQLAQIPCANAQRRTCLAVLQVIIVEHFAARCPFLSSIFYLLSSLAAVPRCVHRWQPVGVSSVSTVTLAQVMQPKQLRSL
jgi:hypothetical protein